MGTVFTRKTVTNLSIQHILPVGLSLAISNGAEGAASQSHSHFGLDPNTVPDLLPVSWSLFKCHFLHAQEQCIPLRKKSSKGGRRPAWLNKELLAELRGKRKVHGILERGAGHLGRVQECD